MFTAIWHYIWPELVGFIHTITDTFSSDHSALKSRWGTRSFMSPYKLSTGLGLPLRREPPKNQFMNGLS